MMWHLNVWVCMCVCVTGDGDQWREVVKSISKSVWKTCVDHIPTMYHHLCSNNIQVSHHTYTYIHTHTHTHTNI